MKTSERRLSARDLTRPGPIGPANYDQDHEHDHDHDHEYDRRHDHCLAHDHDHDRVMSNMIACMCKHDISAFNVGDEAPWIAFYETN